MKERLRGLPVIGFAVRVQDRVGELQGAYLASGIAFMAFLSLFPLLLTAIAIAGFFSQGDASFASDVVDALGITGSAAKSVRDAIETAEESRRAASIIGVVGLLWTGLGVVAALQRAINAAWQVTGRGMADKLFALLWLAGAVVLFAISFGLTTLLNFLPGFFAPVSIVLGLAINLVLFLWTFRALGHVKVGWRHLLPGAIFCAIGFEILKIVGTVYVPHLVSSSSALYGSVGTVFAIIAWLGFFARLIVYGAVTNVIWHEDDVGTVTTEIEVPRLDADGVPVAVDRSGAVTERETGLEVE